MKLIAAMIVAAFILGGCATKFVDKEFGQATRFAADVQVAYPDYRYAEKIPENLPGINAEEIMNIHNQTFAEKPAQVNIFEIGQLQ